MYQLSVKPAQIDANDLWRGATLSILTWVGCFFSLVAIQNTYIFICIVYVLHVPLISICAIIGRVECNNNSCVLWPFAHYTWSMNKNMGGNTHHKISINFHHWNECFVINGPRFFFFVDVTAIKWRMNRLDFLPFRITFISSNVRCFVRRSGCDVFIIILVHFLHTNRSCRIVLYENSNRAMCEIRNAHNDSVKVSKMPEFVFNFRGWVDGLLLLMAKYPWPGVIIILSLLGRICGWQIDRSVPFGLLGCSERWRDIIRVWVTAEQYYEVVECGTSSCFLVAGDAGVFYCFVAGALQDQINKQLLLMMDFLLRERKWEDIYFKNLIFDVARLRLTECLCSGWYDVRPNIKLLAQQSRIAAINCSEMFAVAVARATAFLSFRIRWVMHGIWFVISTCGARCSKAGTSAQGAQETCVTCVNVKFSPSVTGSYFLLSILFFWLSHCIPTYTLYPIDNVCVCARLLVHECVEHALTSAPDFGAHMNYAPHIKWNDCAKQRNMKPKEKTREKLHIISILVCVEVGIQIKLKPKYVRLHVVVVLAVVVCCV